MSTVKKKKNKNLKKRILNIFILVCFTAAAYLFYQSLMTKMDEKNSNETYSEIEDLYAEGIAINIDHGTVPDPTKDPLPIESSEPTPVATDIPAPTPIITEEPEPTPTVNPGPGDTIPQRSLIDRDEVLDSFQPLLDANEDIRGYIMMAESTIRYPVVQGIDNKYYLEHSIYGEKTISASIFMDYRNNTDVLDDNTIIYGHNLNTNMFNDLDFFVDEETRDDFYKANGIFRFDTVYKYMQWEVYSTYVVDVDDFNYLITNFSDESSHKAFLDETLERSAVDWGISVTTSDTILTLSTCNRWFNNSRTVVHARLITP